MPEALNLSNEVVKMRAEVKRVKVLLIRKLTRQISVLQKKKGSEADLEKFRRRATRLREEIHELKVVAPDSVTKAALQKDFSFEKVCRDKEATLSERATARIVTHPQFSKRIQRIKESIKAFKDDRINARKAEKRAKKNAENVTSQNQPQASSNDDDVGSEKSNDEKLKAEENEKKSNEQQELIDSSSQQSQKMSLETLNEQANRCQKEEKLTVEDLSKAADIPDEVIRMRKEVKRTRVVIISKMAEELAFLKKKKGEESEVKESQERAAVIMKEIQALRSLKPDQVTMAALQENAELDKILQDPQASPVDRAIAHIVTHSRFINKLQKVKEAIKEEKAKAVEAEKKKADKLNILQAENKNEEDEEPEYDNDSNDCKEDVNELDEKLDGVPTEIHKSDLVDQTEITEPDASELPTSKPQVTAPNVQCFPEKSSAAPNVQRSPENSSSAANVQRSPEKSSSAANVQRSPEKSSSAASVQRSLEKSSIALNVQSSPEEPLIVNSTESGPSKNIGKADKEMKTILKSQKKQDLPQTKTLEAEKEDEESDLSDDDDEEEEKEYFDDSTEERFHKQSSQSEDSDYDDFFLGKVSKLKKRKSNQGNVEKKKSELQKPDKEAKSKPQETNLGKLESVFCSMLSKSTVSSQKAKHGSQNDSPRPPRFQNQRKGPEGRMKASQYKDQDLGADRNKPQTFKVAGQRHAGPSGAGRGRSKFEQHLIPKGPPGKMSNPPQQSLHPSWEASRKRKEQQAQITAFQGKKIRFDDDN